MRVDSRKSKFDSSHLVVFLEEDDEQYDAMKKMFNKHGLAFKHGKTIVMDWTTIQKEGYGHDSFVTFIESHELGHTVLGHNVTKKEFEAEADYVGVLLCGARKFTKSERVGKQYFKRRNGISFEKYAKENDKRLRQKLSKTKYRK